MKKTVEPENKQVKVITGPPTFQQATMKSPEVGGVAAGDIICIVGVVWVRKRNAVGGVRSEQWLDQHS